MTYDNIKSHKKAGPHPLSENTFLEKTTGGGQINPPPPIPLPAFVGLITKAFLQSI